MQGGVRQPDVSLNRHLEDESRRVGPVAAWSNETRERDGCRTWRDCLEPPTIRIRMFHAVRRSEEPEHPARGHDGPSILMDRYRYADRVSNAQRQSVHPVGRGHDNVGGPSAGITRRDCRRAADHEPKGKKGNLFTEHWSPTRAEPVWLSPHPNVVPKEEITRRPA